MALFSDLENGCFKGIGTDMNSVDLIERGLCLVELHCREVLFKKDGKAKVVPVVNKNTHDISICMEDQTEYLIKVISRTNYQDKQFGMTEDDWNSMEHLLYVLAFVVINGVDTYSIKYYVNPNNTFGRAMTVVNNKPIAPIYYNDNGVQEKYNEEFYSTWNNIWKNTANSNRDTKRIGELMAFVYMKQQHREDNTRVTWMNERQEWGYPYDLIIEDNREAAKPKYKYIEVKTTTKQPSQTEDFFKLTKNEWNEAKEKGDSYTVLRIVLLKPEPNNPSSKWMYTLRFFVDPYKSNQLYRKVLIHDD